MLLFSFSIINREKQKSELKYVVSLRPACDHMCVSCVQTRRSALHHAPHRQPLGNRERRRPGDQARNPRTQTRVKEAEPQRSLTQTHTHTHILTQTNTHSHTHTLTHTHTHTRLGPQRQLRDTSPILVFVLILVPSCIRAHTHWFF